MFDKKNKRSSSRTRDDSPEYGFDSRSDAAKLYWDSTIPGKADLPKADQTPYSRSSNEDRKVYTALSNSNLTYKSSYVSARRENTERDGGCAPYCRPASSLGMTSFNSPVSPASKYAKQRRGSISGFDDNEFGSKFTSCGSYWRSKSIDMSPNGFTEYQRRSPSIKVASYTSEAKENGNKVYRDEPSSISSNIWSRTYQKPNKTQYESPVPALISRKPLTRTEAFDSATQFSDAIDSQYKHSSFSAGFHGCDETSLVSPPKSRLRHKTLAYGVSKDDLNCAKSVAYNQGSNEDMKKVLLELDNTGYFSEDIPQSSEEESPNTANHNGQNGYMNYKKLWEDSKSENTRLKLELGEVKNDLESITSQLEAMAIQAVNHKSLSDAEKREKIIVLKKLEEMEEELKLLAYSENLTDQTLDQLRSDNYRLREENQALLRVMSKFSK